MDTQERSTIYDVTIAQPNIEIVPLKTKRSYNLYKINALKNHTLVKETLSCKFTECHYNVYLLQLVRYSVKCYKYHDVIYSITSFIRSHV